VLATIYNLCAIIQPQSAQSNIYRTWH